HAGLMRGALDVATLEQLLGRSGALYGGRGPEAHYVAAALGAVEMVRTGTTTAFDLVLTLPLPDPECLDAVVQAYRDVGLRALVAPAVADIAFYRTVPGLLDLL